MSWRYRMRWVFVRGQWHIDDCTSDEFKTVCAETYIVEDVKQSQKPEQVCRKCERLVVRQILQYGPPIHEGDDPRLGGDPR